MPAMQDLGTIRMVELGIEARMIHYSRGDEMNDRQAHIEYLDKHSTLSRQELLHLCRMGGVSAHRIKSNRELAELLWLNFGKPAYLRKHENARTIL